MNTKTFYLQVDKNEGVNFNGKVLNFTLQLIESWNIEWVFKNFKVIVIVLVKNTTPVQKKNIVGEVTFNIKTGIEIKLLNAQCSTCGRKNSMIVGDKTIQAESLGDFFTNLGKKGLNAPKTMAKLYSRTQDVS